MAAEDFGMTPAFCSHGVNEGREEDHCVSNLLLKQGGFASHGRLSPLMLSLARADIRGAYSSSPCLTSHEGTISQPAPKRE